MQFGISESIIHWARYRNKKVAIYSNGIQISYNQFNSRINSLSKKINDINPSAKRIGLAIKSKIDLMVSIVSVIRTGKSAVILNVNLSDDSLRTNIEDTEIEILIHDDNYLNINELCSDSNIISFNLHNFFDKVKDEIKYSSHNSAPDSEWGILFSSGTTGTPKGIERDHNSMVTEFLGWCLELGLSRQTVFYIGRPIYYTGGLVLALATFIVGGCIIINDYHDDNNFDLIWEDFVKTLEHIEIEWAFFVPDQVRYFSAKIIEQNIKIIDNSKNILVMGAPISGCEKTLAYELLHSNIIESWGNTESLGTITEAEDLFIRPDSIGRPFITDELFIVDENLKQQPPNTIGRITGSEEAGFSKYSNRPKETERIKQNDLIVSDDLGYIDDNGFFYIKGRVQERIIIKGKTIFTFDIEEKIKNLSFVNNCCIVFKGTHSCEGMCIAITVKNNINNMLAIANVTALLSKSDIAFNSIQIINSLPRLTSGKIDKIKLIETFDE